MSFRDLNSPSMDTRPVDVSLLRSIDCSHNREGWRMVSELVIYRDPTPAFGPQYEIARQVIVCTVCGLPVEVRDMERDCKPGSVGG